MTKPHSNFYTVEIDKATKLQHVKINAAGLKIIAEKYRRDPRYQAFNINIVVENYQEKSQENEILLKHIDSLQEGEFRGVVMVEEFWDGRVFHSIPILLAKKDGKIFIVEFELSALRTDDLLHEAEQDIILKKAKDYKTFQSDSFSCSTFAVDILKNCFLDRKFLEQASQETEGVFIEKPLKPVMKQSTSACESTDLERRSKYYRVILGQEYNLKAFYKGHFYTLIINPEHLRDPKILDEKTIQAFLDIDGQRKDFKEQKTLTTKKSKGPRTHISLGAAARAGDALKLETKAP